MNEKKLTIALDYDYTYTEMPDLWKQFIGAVEQHGHTVVCVTGRTVPPGLGEIQLPVSVNVVCAGELAKDEAASNAGYDVDIWIDDMPETIPTL